MASAIISVWKQTLHITLRRKTPIVEEHVLGWEGAELSLHSNEHSVHVEQKEIKVCIFKCFVLALPLLWAATEMMEIFYDLFLPFINIEVHSKLWLTPLIEMFENAALKRTKKLVISKYYTLQSNEISAHRYITR